jgi:hypothetical protein
MRKLYRILLSPEERCELEKLGRKRNAAAHKVLKARALLLCDESGAGEALTDGEITRRLGIAPATLERLRRRCCESGPSEALERKKQERPSRSRKIDGAAEARLVTLACSEPPQGSKRWTLRLLAERLVELEVVDAVSYETVRGALKKTRSSPG